MSKADKRRFTYRIDASDTLAEVNEDWVEFARANWRPDFSPDEVLGRCLWASVADSSTRHIQQLLVKRVRGSGRPLAMPFRCDSPETRRFMELTISLLAAGGVELSGRILREEQRPKVPLLAADRPRSSLMLVMCGWCKKIRTPEWTVAELWSQRTGTWWEVEELGSMLEGLHWEYLPDVSHSICPACYRMVMQKKEEAERSEGWRGTD
jgi:hypothetical protein